jgi:hypothetical protein
MVEWYLQGKTEELGEIPVSVPLCPPQIPHGLTWVQTKASRVRGRSLTTWAMIKFWHNFQDVRVPPGILIHRNVNKLRLASLLLDRRPNENVRCSQKINWMKLILVLNILLKIPQMPCTGDCFQIHQYELRPWHKIYTSRMFMGHHYK